MSQAANRGKGAEAKVRARLDFICQAKDCDFYRLPDAHAGSRQPTLADFLFFHGGQTTVIEVKEVGHDYRLPHKNFSPDQVARMRKLKWAGVNCIVLIHHTTTGLWRGCDIDRFIEREGGSWDLRDLKATTLDGLLDRPKSNEPS